MEKQDIYESLIGLLFPSDITEHFKIVHIESLPQVMVVHFEEKDEFHDKEGGHEYVPNGFYESSRINDFPIRDKKVTLVVKRRRWIDKSTGKSVGNKYTLTAEGTRHSKEFAAFLKGIFGQLPDSGTES
ncbi:ISAon1 family transposase N-terminal region protein [Ileibacterium valens]|uniref:ISAon1 family transposase N-terminal region protein n=1 Tax=Ileibacterium valens TaxID=1862668 RepID=UPI0032200DB2